MIRMDMIEIVRQLSDVLTATNEFAKFKALRKQVMNNQKYRIMFEECEQNQNLERCSELLGIPELSAYFAAERDFATVMNNVLQSLHELIYEYIKK